MSIQNLLQQTNLANKQFDLYCNSIISNQAFFPSIAEQVVWQPLGTKTNQVGTTWAETYANLQSITNDIDYKMILLDPSKWIDAGSPSPSPFDIPTGTYNLHQTELIHAHIKYVITPAPPNATIPLTIQNGVKLVGLRQISGPITVDYQGNNTGVIPPVATQTGACIDIDIAALPGNQGSFFFLEYGASVSCSGTAPFIEFTNSTMSPIYGQLALNTGAAIYHNVSPVIRILDSPNGTGPNIILPILSNYSAFASDVISTLGSLGTSAITSGSFSFSVLDPINVGGLPFVAGTYCPSCAAGTVSAGRSLETVCSTTQNGNPGVGNDGTQLFKNGDIWINSVGPSAHICTSTATGAASWT